MAGVRALVLLALLGAASAFAPPASSGLKLRAAPRAVSKTPMRMGAGKLPPGPQGRGAFDEGDTFELSDGRMYSPADATTDAMAVFGQEDLQLPDSLKAVVFLGGSAFALVVPFVLIKVIGGY